MHIPRSIFNQLRAWKGKASRKVLLLRGARQVGKTFIVRQLGQEFKSFIEVNLLEQPQVHTLFSNKSLDPAGILQNISAFFGIPIVDGETLIFFDEIQACPDAISALRFFHEKRPHLHVIATGSLLEFALEELPSFGVGRVEYLYMYPITYFEFLVALKEELLLEQIKRASPTSPLSELLHNKSLALLKTYLSIGGMPEVLANYAQTQSLNDVGRLHSLIVTGYEDDFAKYRKRLQTEQLRETFRSAAVQVGKKFVYSHAYRDANSKTVHQALETIVKAGIVHKVFHSSGNGLPLGAEKDLTKFKTLPLDIGIYSRLSGLPVSELALLDPLMLITKGPLAEAYCGLEILWSQPSYAQETLFYWHRESKSANAEVDYLLQLHGKIFPLEVKSSGKGAMHSLRIFMQEKKRALGIRVSTENFGRLDDILIVPLYAVAELNRLLANEYTNQ